MLTSIKVTGFRALQSLEAKDLGRVNLLVGKNNAGKTSLLEAIYLGLCNITPAVIQNIMQLRGEITTSSDNESVPKITTPVRHLFYGHPQHQNATFNIERIETSGQETIVQCDLVASQLRETSLTIQIQGNPEEDTVNIPLANNGGLVMTGYDLGYDSLLDTVKGPFRMVPNTSLTPEQMNYCWAEITLTPEEDEIVRALQLIDPKIKRINFSVHTINKSDIMVLHADQGKIPFSSVGDGMYKLLALFLALIRVKGGYFFIDEIDTGLHYSVMQKMWEMVIETAKRLDIQVFATTHSQDCIDSLAWLFEKRPELQEEMRLIYLEKDKSPATTYTGKEIKIAVENQMEMR